MDSLPSSPQTPQPQTKDLPGSIDKALAFEQSLKETEYIVGDSLLLLAKSFKQHVSTELTPAAQSKAIADAEKLTRTLERARKFGGADISKSKPNNTDPDNTPGGCNTFAEAGGQPYA